MLKGMDNVENDSLSASRENQPTQEYLPDAGSRLTKSPRSGLLRAHSQRVACGRILKWPTRADCKSAGLRLRRFESFSYHHPHEPQYKQGISHICPFGAGKS